MRKVPYLIIVLIIPVLALSAQAAIQESAPVESIHNIEQSRGADNKSNFMIQVNKDKRNASVISFDITNAIFEEATHFYNWNFGDGDISTNKEASHMYAVSGDYNVSLLVIAQDGAEYSITTQVVVALKEPTQQFTVVTDDRQRTKQRI